MMLYVEFFLLASLYFLHTRSSLSRLKLFMMPIAFFILFYSQDIIISLSQSCFIAAIVAFVLLCIIIYDEVSCFVFFMSDFIGEL